MQILGFDVGGTGIKAAIVDTATGALCDARTRIQTPRPATPAAVSAALIVQAPSSVVAVPTSVGYGASLGGVTILALYLQKRRGWRAGWVQMAIDCVILSIGLFVLSADKVALSVLGAAALNFVIAVNHRPDRYFGI